MSVIGLTCGSGREFADWTIPPPEGTTIIEHGAVPLVDRIDRIELVEDLVIGERGDDPDYRFYNASWPAAANEEIFVLDAGNHRVQVFDANGDFVRSFGAEGRGPGEFVRPQSFTLTASKVMVNDFDARRYGVFSLDGEHLGELSYPDRFAPIGLTALDDGTLIGRARIRDESVDQAFTGTTGPFALIRYSEEMKELNEIQRFPATQRLVVIRRSETRSSMVTVGVPTPRLTFGVTPAGEVYATTGDEYQIMALDEAGAWRWALRATWSRDPMTDGDVARAMERVRGRIPDATPSEVEIPKFKPALDHITVDGHGHVYVFPFHADRESADVPVDVYSAAGERLFAGWIPRLTWASARGDFVYDTDSNEATGEERVLRYKLVEPFE